MTPIDFEAAKQAVAERHGYEHFDSCLIYHFKYDESAYKEVAELLANECVKEDRASAVNISFYDPNHDAGIVLLSTLKSLPLPFPEKP